MDELHQKNKKITIGVAIIVVLIAVLIIASIAVEMLSNRDNGDGAAPSLPSFFINGDLDYEERKTGGVSIPTAQGYNFLHGQMEQEILLSNPSTNTCDFFISIYLSDGTLLYQSERVVPGEALTTITISQPLKSGVYRNSVIVYECYKHNTQTPLTRIEVTVELNCV